MELLTFSFLLFFGLFFFFVGLVSALTHSQAPLFFAFWVCFVLFCFFPVLPPTVLAHSRTQSSRVRVSKTVNKNRHHSHAGSTVARSQHCCHCCTVLPAPPAPIARSLTACLLETPALRSAFDALIRFLPN